MYVLKCANGMYYTGSTKNLELRLAQHQNGEGANFTKKHLPVELVYYEEFHRIDEAFYREKQVQGWSRKKKEALINGDYNKLPELSRNYTQYGISTSSMPERSSIPENTPFVEPVETNSLETNNDISTSSMSERCSMSGRSSFLL